MPEVSRHMDTSLNRSQMSLPTAANILEFRHAASHEVPFTDLKESEVAQSCPTLCDPIGCSLPGSSIGEIFQARVPEWVTISFSRGSSWPRDRIPVSRTPGRCFTVWATGKTRPLYWSRENQINIWQYWLHISILNISLCCLPLEDPLGGLRSSPAPPPPLRTISSPRAVPTHSSLLCTRWPLSTWETAICSLGPESNVHFWRILYITYIWNLKNTTD